MSASIHFSVGLTGLMGAGKTEAANYFKRTGYPVLFMDQVGHDCLQETDIIEELVETFGDVILDKSNTINRKKLSQLVFHDQEKLNSLNRILHPKMNQKAKKWIAVHFNQGRQIVFLEAAILFKMKMNKFLDYTVLIKAAEKDLVKRIIKRDRKSEKEIQQIFETQKMNETKVDYVIMNAGSLNDLYQRCNKLLKQLRSDIKSL